MEISKIVQIATLVLMKETECSYPMTIRSEECVCDYHGEPFVGATIGDVYGKMSYMGGYCPVQLKLAQAVVAAITPRLNVLAVQRVADDMDPDLSSVDYNDEPLVNWVVSQHDKWLDEYLYELERKIEQ